MRLSAPIYKLKRRAKLRARTDKTRLYEALDRVAQEEGFQSWSHLVSSSSKQSPAATILSRLRQGDLVLLGARPGHGKTLLGIELAAETQRLGGTGIFFTLDYNEQDVRNRLIALGIDPSDNANSIEIHTSDEICASYITDQLHRTNEKAVFVVDYLQLLDQKRTHPTLQDQVAALRTFAQTEGVVVVLISQIDRSFDKGRKSIPDLSDVRLPNPVDLSLFDKACFMHDGEIRLGATV